MLLNAPGTFPGVPKHHYLRAPAVSFSLLDVLITRCPGAAWFVSWLNPDKPESESSARMDFGTIAHAILLEGDYSVLAVIDRNDYPAKTTGSIPEGWTNQAIRAARDAAIAAGKIPILKDDFAAVEAMVEAARAFIASLETEEPAVWAAFQKDGGDSELSIVWEDGGALCRIRPDRISKDRTLVVDYKTGDGSAEPNSWGRSQMIRMAYYTGAAFYRRGIKAAFGKTCEYVFLVQETQAPYLCSLVGVDEIGFNLGAQKIEYGLNLWRKCARSNVWPTYPPRVCYAEIPAWESTQWEEFQALGIPYDPEQLWGAPRKNREESRA